MSNIMNKIFGVVGVRKVVAVIIVWLLLISGLIAYDFSKFNSDPMTGDIGTEAQYKYIIQDDQGNV